MLKMAVLLSGSGRTLDNFHERITDGRLAAAIEVVVSDVKEALGLEKAANYGYPAFHAPTSAETNRILKDYDVDIIVLAGYLKLYTPPDDLKKAVINIHPALIPSFCGKGFYGHHVHSAVRAKGCTVSGCTVHFANERYDEGPIILQKSVDLEYDDDADTIADKVFAIECETFPEAINRVDEKGIEFFWKRVGR
ncbi:phosphoribosylglycinamide formyltransferase [Desulforhopalus singaporensis]|uniref:phosphoribosylglycinamide formyltransferase 1 n=1 Tax=Desulforhopalus singaporensis TaxID=91360 RepID=A0A1H0U685_9BACT|nr:phosphoribosylglycinamide formyltransferase [Desulforhopalus singaporensis]SDP61669.1 phosphoribosylglycinamide formyltransferase-1 [Desulforhopalus singaporensis]